MPHKQQGVVWMDGLNLLASGVPYLVPALGMGAETPVGTTLQCCLAGSSQECLQEYRDKDNSSPVGTARNNTERKGV